MCPTITAITTYVLQQLDVRRFWTVRSVYKKTVNIQAGELLLALQAASSPMSPISMLTDMEVRDFEALPVKPGQQVSISRDRIHGNPGDVSVTAKRSPKHPFNLPSCSVSLGQASLTGPAGHHRLTGRHIPSSVLRFHGPAGCKDRRGIQPDPTAAQNHIRQCGICLEQGMYGGMPPKAWPD